MIPNDQPLRRQIIERMLNDLDIVELGELTQWEINFRSSVWEQFENKGDLSDRQCEILERIYDKVK